MEDRRRGSAATAPGAPDPQLRGRTYAVPFEDVWQAALRLAAGGLSRWHLQTHDDGDGVIRARTKGIAGAMHGVCIRIVLDENAQTRVDAEAVAEGPRDFGAARRRLVRFFAALDRALENPPVRSPLRPPAKARAAHDAGMEPARRR
jgi:hypothetical protein